MYCFYQPNYWNVSHLHVEWVEVADGLALSPLRVVVKAQQIQQVVAVVVEARPEDVHLGLADGGRPLVLDVVDVDDLHADLVLVFVAVGERGGDVVLDLGRVGLAGDAEVGLDPDGDSEGQPVVLLVAAASLRVAGLGQQGEGELCDGILQAVGGGLQEYPGNHLDTSYDGNKKSKKTTMETT